MTTQAFSSAASAADSQANLAAAGSATSSLSSAAPASEQTQTLALTTLFIALLAISLAPILIRFSETSLSANATVFGRFFVFSAVFGGGKLLRSALTDSKPAVSEPPAASLTPQMKPWLMLGSVGVLSCCSLVLWAMSLEHTTVAKSMLLNNLTPFFTSLGSWLLLGRRFDRRFLLGLAIALGGALYLGLDDLKGSGGLLLGDLCALLSAVFLGGYFLVVEQLRDRFSATTILLWRCATGMMLLLPLLITAGDDIVPTTATALLAVLGLGLVSEGLGQRLIADCMSQLSCSFVSLFLLLEPVVSALLAWGIFGEALNFQTGIGFVIVLGGIYLAQTSESATLEP